jgi:predicted secreted protein
MNSICIGVGGNTSADQAFLRFHRSRALFATALPAACLVISSLFFVVMMVSTIVINACRNLAIAGEKL